MRHRKPQVHASLFAADPITGRTGAALYELSARSVNGLMAQMAHELANVAARENTTNFDIHVEFDS